MQLPEIRRTVFLYICAFLKELLSHTQDNGLDAKTLGNVFLFCLKIFNILREDSIKNNFSQKCLKLHNFSLICFR